MNFIKLFISILLSNNVSAQLGGQGPDQFGCYRDGGYTYCLSSQRCIRTWEEDCEQLYDYSNEVVTDYCDNSPEQMCRMVCAQPTCGENQCAVRTDSCCSFICQDNLMGDGYPVVGIEGPELVPNIKPPPLPPPPPPLVQQQGNIISPQPCAPCPPPLPCPNAMRPISSNCEFTPPSVNECGCQTSCGSFECQSNISEEGEECGGYMPQGMARHCAEGLDCVNIMGPMIADAPGICQPLCQFQRDSWGNCIDEGCSKWFDGCNTCELSDNNILRCTEKMCRSNKDPHCIQFQGESGNSPQIPLNCLTWFDGCNECSVSSGEIQLCTLMMCFTQSEPYCRTFTTDPLIEGDICYRFCEDNSQNHIDRRHECPEGTVCSSETDQIGFDNCGENSLKCLSSTGH